MHLQNLIEDLERLSAVQHFMRICVPTMNWEGKLVAVERPHAHVTDISLSRSPPATVHCPHLFTCEQLHRKWTEMELKKCPWTEIIQFKPLSCRQSASV